MTDADRSSVRDTLARALPRTGPQKGWMAIRTTLFTTLAIGGAGAGRVFRLVE
jgi:hypothetical protein